MNSISPSGGALARQGILVLALLMSTNASAEAIATVNGVDIDQAVYDVYVETRFGKSAADATEQEKSTALQELTDIYLLTTQPAVKEIEKEPRTQAQMELQRRGFLAQAAATTYIQDNPATEAEILAEYESQVALAPDQQYKARHILVETQAAAQEIIGQLKSGADFEELAKEKSTGPSGPNGGDLGWFPPDQMVKPFSDAVANLENGSFTQDPVQTQFGWHVILREDSRQAEPPTLDSVREVVKQRVEQVKFQQYLESLRDANSG